MVWTEKQDAELLSLRKAGHTFEEIARRMRLTKGMVIGRHQRLTGLYETFNSTIDEQRKRLPSQIRRAERNLRRWRAQLAELEQTT